jgi:hypothetical protein
MIFGDINSILAARPVTLQRNVADYFGYPGSFLKNIAISGV